MKNDYYKNEDYLEIEFFCNEVIADYTAQTAYYEKCISDLESELHDLKEKGNKEDEINALNEKLTRYKKFYEESFIKTNKIRHFVDFYYQLLNNAEKEIIYQKTLVDEKKDNSVGKTRRFNLREIERNKLANELHDSCIQNMTGITHKCELAIRLFEIDETRARMEVASMVDDLKKTIMDLRDIIYDLRPPTLNDFDLIDSIQNYCTHKDQLKTVRVFVKTENQKRDLSDIIKTNLYRIAQEAFNNILEHSGAHTAKFVLIYNEDTVSLKITDDGVGISEDVKTEKEKNEHHFGMLIMKERAEFLNGKFEIFAPKNKGTGILVTVPYKY